MDGIQYFLESSTIHGLSYISNSNIKQVRIFWLFIVVGGFSGAAVMIYESFQSWNESPVKTKIETHPITNITFPKIIVCPPKNTYTELNFDLMKAENMTLSKDIRNKLVSYALELFLDPYYDAIMTNMTTRQYGIMTT